MTKIGDSIIVEIDKERYEITKQGVSGGRLTQNLMRCSGN